MENFKDKTDARYGAQHLYYALWLLPLAINDFILKMLMDDIFANIDNDDLSNASCITDALDGFVSKINDFVNENIGDIHLIMDATSIDEEIPQDKITSIKNASLKTKHLVSYIKIEMDELIEELRTTPVPEDKQDLWDAIKPAVLNCFGRCQAAISDAEALVQKIEELTKDFIVNNKATEV